MALLLKAQSIKEESSGDRPSAILICRAQSGGSPKDGKGSGPLSQL